MVNKNYQRGRAKEYRVKKNYEECGYYVVRAAGSHSVCDLIAMKNGVTIPIQVKPKDGYLTPKERHDIREFEMLTKFKVIVE